MLTCAVCGGSEFIAHDVLWDDLIEKWELSPYEVQYVNRQQGECCRNCGSNLRSIALAKAIVDAYGFGGTLDQFTGSDPASDLKVLEINEAGMLSGILRKLPGHTFAAYPSCDMMNMEFDDGEWDMIVHSDTLEHVADPVTALSECRRVLADTGRCFFTIPIIVDRPTRSRAGLPPSYHGSRDTTDAGYRVHTEFGMDFWTYAAKAGFTRCQMHFLDFPAAIAIEVSGNKT